MLRNIFLVLFVIILPAIQMVVMGMSMGNDPKPLKLGLVNQELGAAGGCGPDSMEYMDDCIVANLSCRYLNSLPLEVITLVNYKTAAEARMDIELGQIRGFMIFPDGFSDAMFARSTSELASISNETLESSTIALEMDASNAVVTKSIHRIVFDSYIKFVQKLLTDCGMNPDIARFPIKLQNPIYGSYDSTLRDFIASGTVVGIAIFFPLLSSSITFIWDKKLGTMERARVAGAQTWEIMASYFVTECVILCLQTTVSCLNLLYVFEISIVGSPALAVSLLLLNGLAGISLGLLIASLCSEEIQAVIIGLALTFPNFFLAGSFWPIEGMPLALQYMSYALPGSLACEAFRSIVVRGWGFSHHFVWVGFASTFGWLCLYWALGIYVHRVTLREK